MEVILRAVPGQVSRAEGRNSKSVAMTTIDLTRAPLTDQFKRPITYLRISVTDKCNLRCVYCMPETGLAWLAKSEILTYEEIAKLVEAAASAGVRSVRLSGGEPLIRRDLHRLVSSLHAIDGIEDISLSTNGLLLAEQISELRAGGLGRVNVSLDTLRADRFEAIARRPGLERVLAGIGAAIDAGMEPVKINVVVMRGQNDDEIADFAEWTRRQPVFVRFIEVMPVHENVGLQRDTYVSADEILERVKLVGELRQSLGPGGNGPARYFAFDGAPGAVGVISPLSHDYCERCNRVRLTADGHLRLCLFGDQDVDLRTPLRSGESIEGLADILRSAMLIKPERHHLRLGETSSRMRAFSEIGG
jgi:cyclic pyranopterin phosphate synthase